jgi:hypothetical protein
MTWFLDRHLPSLLQANNLPAWKIKKQAFLYTASDQSQALASHPSLQALAAQCANVEIVNIGSVAELRQLKGKYGLMATCQKHAVERAWKADAGIMWTYPDTVFSDGSFATVARHAEQGRRAVIAQGICVKAHSWEARSPRLDGRSMVRASLDCLHPMVRHMTWGAPIFTTYPSIMYWDGGAAGLVMRSWHLQPVYVHPRRYEPNFEWTLDGDYLNIAVDLEDCAYADDSDDFLLVELAWRNKGIRLVHKAANVEDIVAWARVDTKPIHRHFVRHPFTFHAGEASTLKPLVASSQSIVDEIVSRLDSPA